MPQCTTVYLLLGKSNNSSSVSSCRALLGIFSAIITSLFRVVLLLFCLYYGKNSIFVSMNTPPEITATQNCETITIVTGSNSYSTLKKSKFNPEQFLTNVDPKDRGLQELEYAGYSGGGSLYYENQKAENTSEFVNQTYLLGYGQLWFKFNTVSNTTPIHLYSYDGNGYQKYYYYCGDVSAFLNTTWVPVVVWLLVNIVPPVLLSIAVLLFTLRSRCVLTSITNPGMIFSAIFSHFHIGPVIWSKSNPGYLSLSPAISFLNIILTFMGLCLNLHLTTAGFGAGDGIALYVVIPIIVCVPIFLFSAIFAMFFLHCFCCKGQSKLGVFNPSDPGRWYIIDTENNVVPEEENVGMDEVPYGKMGN